VRPLVAIDGRAERGERLEGENRFNWECEELAEPEGELEAGAVVAPLQIPDRLIVHPNRGGQVLPRQTALGSKNPEPIVNLVYWTYSFWATICCHIGR
jgi:hypothetical protein